MLRRQAPVRTFIARVLGAKTDERAWRIGADGEEMVAVELFNLNKKDPRWNYLHAIPVGENGSDIDHIVVGPGGVFTLSTKHHPEAKIGVAGDSFLVNGSKVPYVRNSRFEAKRAGELLTKACGFPVKAFGVIVPVGSDMPVVRAQPADVYVVARRTLISWLLAATPKLEASTIDAITAMARRSTTWQAQH